MSKKGPEKRLAGLVYVSLTVVSDTLLCSACPFWFLFRKWKRYQWLKGTKTRQR